VESEKYARPFTYTTSRKSALGIIFLSLFFSFSFLHFNCNFCKNSKRIVIILINTYTKSIIGLFTKLILIVRTVTHKYLLIVIYLLIHVYSVHSFT